MKMSSLNDTFHTKQYDYEISVYLHIMCNFNSCDLAAYQHNNRYTNLANINWK